MGEFLLSILGFDPTNSFLIYTNKVHRAKWKVGDMVAIANPNPKRGTTHRYYRIYNKFYSVDVIHALVHTQDPNIIDRNGYTKNQRAHVDKQIADASAQGALEEALALHYGWHTEAIKQAVTRHRHRAVTERDATPMVADLNALEYYNPDEVPLVPEHITAEQLAKREALLAQWD